MDVATISRARAVSCSQSAKTAMPRASTAKRRVQKKTGGISLRVAPVALHNALLLLRAVDQRSLWPRRPPSGALHCGVQLDGAAVQLLARVGGKPHFRLCNELGRPGCLVQRVASHRSASDNDAPRNRSSVARPCCSHWPTKTCVLCRHSKNSRSSLSQRRNRSQLLISAS